MDLAIGSITEGKVTGITKFGAFVALPGGKSGMVHISEVAGTFVNDIKDHLTEGQMVKVKIIDIDKEGRINLSIKKAEERPRPRMSGASRPYERKPQVNREDLSFEDKLKQFMNESESKMSDLKHHYIDKKGGGGFKRPRGK